LITEDTHKVSEVHSQKDDLYLFATPGSLFVTRVLPDNSRFNNDDELFGWHRESFMNVFNYDLIMYYPSTSKAQYFTKPLS
jgi:hypothetical protein